MKKFLLFLVILLFPLFAQAQQKGVIFQKVGTVLNTAVERESLLVSIFTADEWGNALRTQSSIEITIPDRLGTWGLYVFPRIVSLSTKGNISIYYRKVSWNYKVEDVVAATEVEATWAWNENGFKVYDITTDVPVPFLYIIIDRTSGDGTAAFDLWVTYR